MQILPSAILAAALVTTFVPAALSHSLTDVEQQIHGREMYFQPVDSEAPGFTLQDADGRIVHLADFRDKVVVLHFIYTNCPDVCPLHAERIAEIQAMINRTPMKEQVQFISITTDPKHDTGRVLHDYGAAHGLDPVNWIFLTAAPDQPEDATRKIAEAYGLKFMQSEDDMQMHAVVTHVIDQDGRLRGRFHTLKFEPVSLVTYVNALVNRAQAPHEHREESLWSKMMRLF
jgi:protein SCO1/2